MKPNEAYETAHYSEEPLCEQPSPATDCVLRTLCTNNFLFSCPYTTTLNLPIMLVSMYMINKPF